MARAECSSPILWSLDSAIIPNKTEPDPSDAGLDAVLRRKIETGSLDVFLKSEPDPMKQLIWGITGKRGPSTVFHKSCDYRNRYRAACFSLRGATMLV